MFLWHTHVRVEPYKVRAEVRSRRSGVQGEGLTCGWVTRRSVGLKTDMPYSRKIGEIFSGDLAQ
eukprot:2018330-Pyramimonas_sp.AAC.1